MVLMYLLAKLQRLCCVCVFVKYPNTRKSFFGKTKFYLRHLSSAYRLEYLREIYEQLCYLEILCSNSFDDTTDCQNLWGYGSISRKAVLIFSKNLLDFRVDTIEKQYELCLCNSTWFRGHLSWEIFSSIS